MQYPPPSGEGCSFSAHNYIIAHSFDDVKTEKAGKQDATGLPLEGKVAFEPKAKMTDEVVVGVGSIKLSKIKSFHHLIHRRDGCACGGPPPDCQASATPQEKKS